MFFDVAGSDVKVETEDRENKLLPDPFIIQGRGNTLSYDADDGLTYTRNDIARAVAEVVAMSGAAHQEVRT